ncbi:MAG TPA: GNAT family N-acetyltransferase [Gemmatimonadales bacterium]|nr:GNAT family N-acetyltransferase [Gemmatimonadales bacterium]
MTVTQLSSEHAEEIVTVFCDAFHDYPVMRQVLGPAARYDTRLRTLIGLFVNGRVFRKEPLLGIRDHAGGLIGAATMTLPESPDPPAALITHRDAVWQELGQDARARYEAFTAATHRFAIGARHHHLNMIGVCRPRQGEGLARVLLGAVHALTDLDPDSAGTSLSTEHPPNVPLYQHFGYRVIGHAQVDRGLTTWVLFRERSP